MAQTSPPPIVPTTQQSPPGSRGFLLDVLDGLLAGHVVRKVLFIHSRGAIPAGAAWHVRPRLVFALDGVHQNEVSSGSGSALRDVARGEALYILPRGWTRATWRFEHRIFGIVCHQGFTRFLWYHNLGRGTQAFPTWWYHVMRRRSEACESTLQALTHLGRDGVGNDAVAVPLLEAFMHQVRADLAADHDHGLGEAHRTWQTICAHVEDHCHEAIDRNAVARAFDLHPNYLSRLFTEHGDETFVRFLARRRLERASELLAEHDLPLAEIARRSGFSSSGYLIKVFRAAYGTTPARHQRKVMTRT